MLRNRTNGLSIAPFATLSRELDRMFEGLVDPRTPSASTPALRIWEDENGFELEAEVPGLQAEHLDISVHGNRVTLKGERTETKREKATLHREEWGALRFERTLELPVDLDQDKVTAELRDGILRLTLPKAAGHKPQKVKILAAK